MLELDHVIIRVADLDEAGAEYKRRHGLGSAFGGRHPGMGTANRIIPLERDYLELLAVGDAEELARTRLPLPDPEALVGWMVRTDDIDGVAERLGISVRPMSRQTESGESVEWRLAGLEVLATEPGLPVFIDWSADAPFHPARMEVDHDAAVGGIAWVEVAGDPERIARWCEGGDFEVRVVEGPSRLVAVGVVIGGQEVELRYDHAGTT